MNTKKQNYDIKSSVLEIDTVNGTEGCFVYSRKINEYFSEYKKVSLSNYDELERGLDDHPIFDNTAMKAVLFNVNHIVKINVIIGAEIKQ